MQPSINPSGARAGVSRVGPPGPSVNISEIQKFIARTRDPQNSYIKPRADARGGVEINAIFNALGLTSGCDEADVQRAYDEARSKISPSVLKTIGLPDDVKKDAIAAWDVVFDAYTVLRTGDTLNFFKDQLKPPPPPPVPLAQQAVASTKKLIRSIPWQNAAALGLFSLAAFSFKAREGLHSPTGTEAPPEGIPTQVTQGAPASAQENPGADQETPKSFATYVNEGVICAKNGQEKEAILLFDRARELAIESKNSVNESLVQHWIGVLNMRMGNYSEAKNLLSKAVQLDGTQGALHYNFALTLKHLDELPEALDHALTAAKLEHGDVAFIFTLGKALNDKNNPEQAIKAFQRIAELEPNNSQNLEELGFTYLRLNRIPCADKAFERCLALDPNNAKVKNERIKIRTSALRPLQRELDLKLMEWVRRAPSTPEVMLAAQEFKRMSVLKTEETEMADRHIEKATEYLNLAQSDQKKVDEIEKLGLTYTQLLIKGGRVIREDAAKAVPYYKMAQKLEPSRLEASLNLACCYLKQKKRDLGQRALENMIHLREMPVIMLSFFYSSAKRNLGNDEALDVLSDLQTIYQQNSLLWAYGLALQDQGKHDEALDVFKRVVPHPEWPDKDLNSWAQLYKSSDPNDPVYKSSASLRWNISQSYIALNNFAEAKAALEAEVALEAVTAINIWRDLAHCYQKLSQPSQAKWAVEEALKMKPNDEKSLQLATQLQNFKAVKPRLPLIINFIDEPITQKPKPRYYNPPYQWKKN